MHSPNIKTIEYFVPEESTLHTHWCENLISYMLPNQVPTFSDHAVSFENCLYHMHACTRNHTCKHVRVYTHTHTHKIKMSHEIIKHIPGTETIRESGIFKFD
jgi:hypothetical protein